MLEVPLVVRVSPGGRRVAIEIRTTNWKDDRYDTLCHVYDVDNGTFCPLLQWTGG